MSLEHLLLSWYPSQRGPTSVWSREPRVPNDFLYEGRLHYPEPWPAIRGCGVVNLVGVGLAEKRSTFEIFKNHQTLTHSTRQWAVHSSKARYERLLLYYSRVIHKSVSLKYEPASEQWAVLQLSDTHVYEP